MPKVVINIPVFHPKQQLAFDSPASEILFGGATRAGKSFFIRRSYIIWCSQIPGLLCDIFRVNFDDVIRNYMEGETSFPVLLAPWEKAGLCKINQTEIIFWNESRISLEHCADDTVMQKHQGVARHVRTLEESAQMEEHRIRALTGWVTMSEQMLKRVPEQWKGRFPKILHVTNPVGPSAGFYRRGFIKARPPYAIERVGQFNRQYIPAELQDNPSENFDNTVARIKEAFPDPAMQQALLDANWDSAIGDFFPEYSEARHCVPDFIPPRHWMKFRTFDWGSSDPFCVLWWCVSDGESFEVRRMHDSTEGESRAERAWFPRGSLICYREWYGCNASQPSKGLGIRNEQIAQGIVSRTSPGENITLTLTDSLPFADRGMTKHGKKYLIADEFKDNGVPLTLANTARIFGWKSVRDRLIGKDNLPLIYFVQSAKYTREYLPSLPRHDIDIEDAAESGESTHTCDNVRYACATRPVSSRLEEEKETDYRSKNERITVASLISQINKQERKPYVQRR